MVLKRSSLLWLTVLAITVAAGCQFFPSYAPVEVTVTVLDGVGQPVAGAEITLSGNQEYSTKTDANGVATLRLVHPDNYVLTASYPDGYVTNRTLHLWGGENYAFEFKQSHISEHLVGGWLFDEGAGNVAYDASPRNNHANLVNTEWTAGKYGTGIRMLPDDVNKTYIEIATTDGLSPANQISIVAWVYADSTNGNYRIIQAGQYGNDNISDSHYRFLFESGKLKFQAGEDVNPRLVEIPLDKAMPDGSAFPTGEWVHLAGVYNGKELRIHINGQIVASVEASGTMKRPSNNRIFIGTKHPNAPKGDSWHGVIDEVAVFDRALTESEVLEVMNGLAHVLSYQGE